MFGLVFMPHRTLFGKESNGKSAMGNSIRIWDSPWLNDGNNFYIDTPVVEDLDDMVVSELFIPGS